MSALDCLERQGGGTSFLFHALEVIHKIGAAFLALTPFDKSAAEFWTRAGFSPMQCGWYMRGEIARAAALLCFTIFPQLPTGA